MAPFLDDDAQSKVDCSASKGEEIDPLSPSAHCTTELDFHASGILVRTQGNSTDGALAQFRHFLKLRHLESTTDELVRVLELAKQKYRLGNQRLYVCAAQPCCKQAGYDVSDRELSRLSNQIGAAIVKTGCQGPCKQAPVLALRIGDKQELFAEVASEEDWRAVLKFAKAAVHAKSLLVDTGAAERFRFDPVHDTANQAPI